MSLVDISVVILLQAEIWSQWRFKTISNKLNKEQTSLTESKPRSVERSVDQALVRKVSHALDLIEVEGVLSWQGAVEPGLEERCPVVSQHQLSALIVLADTSDPWVHSL